MNRDSLLLRLAAALCAILVTCAAHAEKTDREKPITFTSDDGEVNYEKRTGVLKGNVVITQGTMTIRADRINFTQNPDNSLSATAFGNPLSFRQKRDDADGYYEGWAQRAEYDGQKEQIELFDNAILKRGDDEIRSNFISYNSATELFRAEGRASSTPKPGAAGRDDRVRGVFQPKSDVLPGKASPGKGTDGKAAPALPLRPSGEIKPAAQ
ncbi:MAG: lipopolysaccharide transport periplasmic protein LptA [Burkholderiales bacterium]|nr:lipopolysaccharide transport periplasmic protein LptA [Burkholderiales bacterium]